jgi:hypothetical protein
MLLRTILASIVLGIIVLLGGVVVWQRNILDNSMARQLDQTARIAELEERLAARERAAAAATDEQLAAVRRAQELLSELKAERDDAAEHVEAVRRQLAQSLGERQRMAEEMATAGLRNVELGARAARAEQEAAALRAALVAATSRPESPSVIASGSSDARRLWAGNPAAADPRDTGAGEQSRTSPFRPVRRARLNGVDEQISPWP